MENSLENNIESIVERMVESIVGSIVGSIVETIMGAEDCSGFAEPDCCPFATSLGGAGGPRALPPHAPRWHPARMPNPPPAVWSPRYACDIGAHVFPTSKYEATFRALVA